MNLSINHKDRVKSIDILRGFAILGIFFVNIPMMLGIELFLEERSYTGFDAYLRLFYDMFVQTKFYTIFSFLFGLGFWIFMSRAEQRGAKVYQLFSRRLVILLLFALLHIFLFWNGDILNTYAFTGFWLLLFYKRKAKTVLIWAIILLVLFELFTFLGTLVEGITETVSYIPAFNYFDSWSGHMYERIHLFISLQIPSNLLLFPEILGLFLLGLYVGKINLFQRVKELGNKIRILQIIALLVTIPCWIMLIVHFTPVNYSPMASYFYVASSGKTLSIFYITSLLMLLEKERWQTLLAPIGYVGRMALTNYLSQTIVTTIIFAVLFTNTAEITLWQTALYCLVFYSLQMIFSKWWLLRYQFGPLEWLWRIGTYGKVQPIKSNGIKKMIS